MLAHGRLVKMNCEKLRNSLHDNEVENEVKRRVCRLRYDELYRVRSPEYVIVDVIIFVSARFAVVGRFFPDMCFFRYH